MNSMLDLFPVAVKQLSPITNILEAEKKGPSVGPNSIQEIMKDGCKEILNIVQIGAGGTGGYVAAEIMRMLGGLPACVKERVFYTLVDGDEFEEKNLGRQLCSEEDIGVNKAVALIDTYADYYDVLAGHAIALPKYINSIEDLTCLKHGIREHKINAYVRQATMPSEDTPRVIVGDLVSKVNEEKVFSKEDLNTINARVALATTDDAQGENVDFVMATDFTPLCNSEREALVVLNDLGCEAGASNFGITTIIIDCVDKTTPRKIIHDYLESLYSMPSALSTLQTFSGGEYGVFTSNQKNECKQGGIPKHICVISNSNDKVKNCINLCREGRFGSHWDLGKFINGDTYIISSGNGKYTGQVYWGRYSPFVHSSKPIRLADIEHSGVSLHPILPKRDISSMIDTEVCDIYRSVVNNVKVISWSLEKELQGTNCGDKLSTESSFINDVINASYRNDITTNIGDKVDDNNENIFSLGSWNIPGAYGLLKHGYEWVETKQVYQVDINNTMSSMDVYASAFVSVPSPYNRNPDLVDVEKDKVEEQMSCAERAAENVQNIAANKTAANLVINYFRGIFNGMFPLEKDASQLLSTVGVKFDVRTNTFVPETLTRSYINDYDSFKLWKDSGREYFSNVKIIGNEVCDNGK